MCIRVKIAQENKEDVWRRIEELLKVVKAEVEAREAGEGVKANPQQNPNVVFNQRSSTHFNHTANAKIYY